jgi:hypothetical protein
MTYIFLHQLRTATSNKHTDALNIDPFAPFFVFR